VAASNVGPTRRLRRHARGNAMTRTRGEPPAVVREGPYPELGWPALIVGWLIGALLAISIGYAALILGFSILGSMVAAILGFGILRGLLRRFSIVENNVVQTIASAVNGASAGIMFSVPALFILGETDFDPYLLAFGCIAGTFLGIAFIIPLRKQMIDFERLSYPHGVAVATVLKSPGAGIQKTLLLVGGALLSAVVHIVVKLGGVENWDLGSLIGLPVYMNGIWYLSLLTVAVGFIAGRGGVAFLIGGFVCYWVIAPLLAATGGFPTIDVGGRLSTVSAPGSLRDLLFRPVGIGMLIGGALAGIIVALPLVLAAIRSMHEASAVRQVGSMDEMPIKVLYFIVAGGALVLFGMAAASTESMGLGRAAALAVLGALWVWLAGVILSECIGRTDWSPLSGMTLVAITLMIVLTRGLGREAAIVSSIMVGAAICVAMAQSSDLMTDLKTGYLVGASPRKQQAAQFLGAWLGPVVVIPLVFVLHQAYGLGSDQLPAPQAQALAGMVDGILGNDVPVQKYIAGASLGALLSLAGGGLGVMVGLGFYLPFSIVLTYTLGTLLRLFIERKVGRTFVDGVAIPVAAGLIVGEALVGVAFAFYMVLTA
jgi:putative OPT family oligopeptide transporter